MSEHPGLFDARAWLVGDAAFSELLRCSVLLYPSVHWSMVGWPLLFLLACGGAAGVRFVLMRPSRIAARRPEAAGLPGVLPEPARSVRRWHTDAGWPIRFASLAVAIRLMAEDAGQVCGMVSSWPFRKVFAWRTRGWRRSRSGSAVAGRPKAWTGSAQVPAPSTIAPLPAVLRPAGRWPGGSLRFGLPAFMWRLLRSQSSTRPLPSLGPFVAALPDTLPDLKGRGVFLVLGPSGTASVLALSVEGGYEITASEQGLRALALRGLAVQGGVPVVEDRRLAARIADVAAPSPVPADCMLSVRQMAQWLREITALSPQGCP